ncbi:hypothetical protein DPMN_165225 [Dreissena polymorpha]|uniref:Uncharacterized protein n=1 Tax=Dreissena polymorpha TaxID=45954 RepID=A0A9D4EUY9_DREPO|nr:hypothetical protein DPMN_165225 [Dreissena polymorpha]
MNLLLQTIVSEISCTSLVHTDNACEPLLESIQNEENTDAHTLNKCKEDHTSLSPSVSKEDSKNGLNESEQDEIPETLLELRKNAEMRDTTTAAKGCQFCIKCVSVYCNSDEEPAHISLGDHIEVRMKGRLGILKHHAIVESFQYQGNGNASIKVIDVEYKNKNYKSFSRKLCSRGEMVIQSH